MLLVRYYDIVIGYIIGPIFRYRCTNHGPVCDVLVQRTSCLDYALFVNKGTLVLVTRTCESHLSLALNIIIKADS